MGVRVSQGAVVRGHILHAEQAAKKAFRDHRIETRLSQGLFRNWQCSRAHSSCYLFNVSTEPCRLFVTGDIGELILCREPDMIAWARKAIDDVSYFASKVPSAIPTTVFDTDVALEWIAEQEQKESTARAEAMEDGREHSSRMPDGFIEEMKLALGDGQAFFEMALYESGYIAGGDWPCFLTWNSGFLWCREAIRWFLANVKES